MVALTAPGPELLMKFPADSIDTATPEALDMIDPPWLIVTSPAVVTTRMV